MLDAIAARRSIRKYKPDPVPQGMIEEILCAGMLAPSSKNRQPWRFIVAAGRAKQEMLAAFDRGIAREKQHALLPGSAPYLAGAVQTRNILAQAPVSIFIVNPLSCDVAQPRDPEAFVAELCNAQSVGAAIENMTLAATALGLGSLWICDTFFAQQELRAWLREPGELMAALAIGFAGEAPPARPRKPAGDVVVWRN